jgi:hypothetical protein
MSTPFQFYMPMVDLAKSDDDKMLFGGFSSSEARDLEGEDVIQKGLVWDPFIDRGWFNENHDSTLSGGGLVGVPVPEKSVTWLRKGDAKPLNEEPAERSGWYVMGQLLDTKEGRSIWDKAVALKKTGTNRRLGMSLEGNVIEREGPRIVKAEVHNIALTQRPVNPETTMEVLTKAFTGEGPWSADTPTKEMQLLERISLQVGRLQKALAAGDAIAAPARADAGDGFAFRREDLDGEKRDVGYGKCGTSPMSKEHEDGGSYGQDYAMGKGSPMMTPENYPAIAANNGDCMAHDGYQGGMLRAAEGQTDSNGGAQMWTPEATYAELDRRYPGMSKTQKAVLVARMFDHLGGT